MSDYQQPMRPHIDVVANNERQYHAAYEIIAEANRIVAQKGQWRCIASCNLQGIGGKVPSVSRVIGEGFGKTEDEACLNAKRAATQKAELGTYPRHCQCKCEKL